MLARSAFADPDPASPSTPPFDRLACRSFPSSPPPKSPKRGSPKGRVVLDPSAIDHCPTPHTPQSPPHDLASYDYTRPAASTRYDAGQLAQPFAQHRIEVHVVSRVHCLAELPPRKINEICLAFERDHGQYRRSVRLCGLAIVHSRHHLLSPPARVSSKARQLL